MIKKLHITGGTVCSCTMKKRLLGVCEKVAVVAQHCKSVQNQLKAFVHWLTFAQCQTATFSYHLLHFIPCLLFLTLLNISESFPLPSFVSLFLSLTVSRPLKAMLCCGRSRQWFSCCCGCSLRNWSHASPFCRPTIEKFHYSLSNVSGELTRSEGKKRGRQQDCFKSDREKRNILMKNVRLGDRQDKRVMAGKYHHYNVSLS